MEETAGPVMLYASRVKAFLFALMCLGFIAFDLLSYFVLPVPVIQTNPWMYYEPGKTIWFIVMFVVFGCMALVYLFFTFKPSPLVILDASQLTYQPYPFLGHSVRWTDVEGAAARQSKVGIAPRLTVWFDITAHAVPSYGGKSLVKVVFPVSLLPVSCDELAALLQHYCHMSYKK